MDDNEVKNVMGEVELLKRLDHPSIVKYMGMHKSSDYLDIILEYVPSTFIPRMLTFRYVEGGSLGSQLKLCRSFNEPLVAIIVAKILEGLAYLHDEGVIHRDLKAANILSTKTGNIKLTDFGVSLNTNAVENIPQEVRTASVRHGKVNWDDIAGTPNWSELALRLTGQMLMTSGTRSDRDERGMLRVRYLVVRMYDCRASYRETTLRRLEGKHEW
jgi:serine/threonine protein kinase